MKGEKKFNSMILFGLVVITALLLLLLGLSITKDNITASKKHEAPQYTITANTPAESYARCMKLENVHKLIEDNDRKKVIEKFICTHDEKQDYLNRLTLIIPTDPKLFTDEEISEAIERLNDDDMLLSLCRADINMFDLDQQESLKQDCEVYYDAKNVCTGQKVNRDLTGMSCHINNLRNVKDISGDIFYCENDPITQRLTYQKMPTSYFRTIHSQCDTITYE